MQLRPTDARPISTGSERQIALDLAAIAKEIRLLLSGTLQQGQPHEFVPLSPDEVSISKLPITGEPLFGRELELGLLDGAWSDAETNVINVVAWGGVGKSALVNHWLGKLAGGRYCGARRVYGWSFYRQGTRATTASADEFLDAALRWFGDADPSTGTPWDKGERLARLVRKERTLLILDGLEPLQEAPGPDEGRIKDPGLAALVRELAAANVGLCIITTRHQVADIEQYRGSTAPVIELEHLSDTAGAELLRALGVHGAPTELEQASREFGGHCLALNLLGTYLRDVCSGDVGRRREVSLLEQDEEQHGHAARIMAAYERELGEGSELAVLHILGLFDRPADAELVNVLRAPPVISGLTDSLSALPDRRWRQVLARLRRARLLAESDPQRSDALDAHPLVREHYGRQLRQQCPNAWREGNNRLYEHLKRTSKELPETLSEMAPLFAAASHGCRAGRHEDVAREVLDARMDRGQAFVVAKLGAIGATLGVLSGFFEEPWRKPVPGLSSTATAMVVSAAGFCLRALGRLTEATQPMHAALEAATAQGHWEKAARRAGNLSELYLNMGNLERSLEYGRQSFDLADRGDDATQRITAGAVLADALHCLNRLDEAEALFRQAEEIQGKREPTRPILSSLQGFRYCSLLLTQGKFREVQRRALVTLKWVEKHQWYLDTALDELSLGRAVLLSVLHEGTGDLRQAANHFDRAVHGLRQAGQHYFLPRGLLARAALQRVLGAFERAVDDLAEAEMIVTRSGMALDHADTDLEYARLHLAMGEKDAARRSLATAKDMIQQMGYHRRDDELVELEKVLPMDRVG